MKLNEYINKLTELLNENGNIDCFGDRFGLRSPNANVAYLRINKPRERAKVFWSSYDGEQYKGEKVIQVWG